VSRDTGCDEIKAAGVLIADAPRDAVPDCPGCIFQSTHGPDRKSETALSACMRAGFNSHPPGFMGVFQRMSQASLPFGHEVLPTWAYVESDVSINGLSGRKRRIFVSLEH